TKSSARVRCIRRPRPATTASSRAREQPRVHAWWMGGEGLDLFAVKGWLHAHVYPAQTGGSVQRAASFLTFLQGSASRRRGSLKAGRRDSSTCQNLREKRTAVGEAKPPFLAPLSHLLMR